MRLEPCTVVIALSVPLLMASPGCVEFEPFSWIQADWRGCERVAVRHTQNDGGGYDEEVVSCEELQAGADSELQKACDFDAPAPAECGPQDASGDLGSEVTGEVASEVGGDVSDDHGPADHGPDDGIGDDVGPGDVSNETPAPDAITPQACAESAPPCYDGVIDGGGECQLVANTAGCDDNNPCTLNDTCAEGVCAGEVNPCDDGIPCTVDSCVADTGACQSDAMLCECASDADCDDGNLCTVDACSPSLECVATPEPDGITCGVPSVDPVVGVCESGQCAGVKQITAGLMHTCALLPFGQVRCWGDNMFGQLGIGSTAPVSLVGPSSPVQVPLAGPAKLIEAGVAHTCAVLETSNIVQCWGQGGALGSGSAQPLMTKEGDAPSYFDLGEAVTDLACGFGHCCAITTSGLVRCWGSGSSGTLATNDTLPILDGTEASSYQMPTDEVIKLAAGISFNCALTDLGKVRCWGAGSQGQLGSQNISNILDGVGPELPSNVPLGGVSGDICAMVDSGCAVVGAAVRCWGNDEGGLGQSPPQDDYRLDGQGLNDQATTVTLGDAIPDTVACGGSHTCTIDTQGDVHCWGENDEGQTGSGVESTSVFFEGASIVTLPGTSSQLALGADHSCALVSGQVVCWGQASLGQLGYGATPNLGDDPDEIPTTFVNLMGVENSHCTEPGDCLSGTCEFNVCLDIF